MHIGVNNNEAVPQITETEVRGDEYEVNNERFWLQEEYKDLINNVGNLNSDVNQVNYSRNKQMNNLKKTRKEDVECCPKLSILVGQKRYEALLDTGSMISVVTRKLYLDFKKQVHQIKEIKSGGLKVFGAFSDRHVEAHSRIILPFKMNELDHLLHHEFKVVEGVNILFIIGSDWLRQQKGVVDIRNNQLIFEDEGTEYTTELLTQEEPKFGTFNIKCVEMPERKSLMRTSWEQRDTSKRFEWKKTNPVEDCEERQLINKKCILEVAREDSRKQDWVGTVQKQEENPIQTTVNENVQNSHENTHEPLWSSQKCHIVKDGTAELNERTSQENVALTRENEFVDTSEDEDEEENDSEESLDTDSADSDENYSTMSEEDEIPYNKMMISIAKHRSETENKRKSAIIVTLKNRARLNQ